MAKPTKNPLTEVPAQAKVTEEAPNVETKELSLLDKAKLISDLAAVWENKELSALLKGLPSGSKVIEVFQDAISREMTAIMSGRAEEKEDRNLQALSAKTEQMASAMGNFHNMVMSFLSSPLVQVLELMNKNLGGRGPQQHPVQPTINSQYSPAAQAGMAAANPQQTQANDPSGDFQPGRRSRAAGLGSP